MSVKYAAKLVDSMFDAVVEFEFDVDAAVIGPDRPRRSSRLSKSGCMLRLQRSMRPKAAEDCSGRQFLLTRLSAHLG